MFGELKDAALNDLHILNLETMEWQSIAIYGILPEARWGHQICANYTNSMVVIFGGMNL